MTVIRTMPQLRHLKRERRFLAQGTLLLLAQRQLLKRLRKVGVETREAERMLQNLEDSQLAISANVTRHECDS
jgi:hypothetical protein